MVAQVGRFLWENWDPIGVNTGEPYWRSTEAAVRSDDPDNTDEYDSYAPGIAKLLLGGADAVKVAARLENITNASMGLQTPKGAYDTIARDLIHRFGNRE